jgi:hypothetical protein
MSYGVGESECFGYKVGKAVRFVEVKTNRRMERNERLEATTVAEIEVTKRNILPFSFLLLLIVYRRHAQWSRYASRRLRRVFDRQVRVLAD